MTRAQALFYSRPSQALFWLVVVIAIGGALLLTAASPGAPRWWWPFQRSAPAVVLATPSSAAAPGGATVPLGWASVAKAAMPAVVNIASDRAVRGGGPQAPFLSDPFFRFSPRTEPAPRRERSLGSGVIVSADGYVLTNNHVIAGAQDIRVTLDDRREFKAAVVGADPKTDLAVLKLPGSSFSVLPLGDSSRVEVAEIVLAIGNPFGLSRTVTMGIVSAVGRANVGIADYEDFIQTDAAINPGNSGGALVNANGALIGINTAIFSQSGGYMGIGFAVPVNMARQVMDLLVTHGRLNRGYLGVSAQELTPTVARGLGLLATRGILVADVIPDGPAARAGLKRGDVITAIDGKPVDDVGHFRNLLAGMAPGTKTRITVLRDGRPQTVEIAVGEMPALASAGAPKQQPGRLGGAGLTLQAITPEIAQKLGLGKRAEGALVVEVEPGGPAAMAGLRPGDVIQEVNRKPVRSPGDLAQAVEQAVEKDLVVLFNRGGNTAYAVIERVG